MLTRLAAIDGVSGDTGVKPQHWLPLAHRGTIPHRHFLLFFYSNKNHLIQLENRLVLSKDPVLRYQVGTKKMKTSRYQVSVNPALAARSESCADALSS